MKKLVIKKDAKKSLLSGAKLLYDAVSTTLGPMGENAVIQTYGEPLVTHDGVTVAKSIEVDEDDPGVALGVEMIKVSSSKSNDNVGDGTTTSTVLAYHLIQEGLNLVEAGKNSQVLRRELNEAANQALEGLKKISEAVDSEKKAINIATISSENEEVGQIVGKMFYTLGKDGLVAVELGQKTEIEHEIVEGYTFDRGVISPYMITDARTLTTTIENPNILCSTKSLSFADIATVVSHLIDEGENNLVVICDDFKQDLLAASIQERGRFDLIGIKAPGFGETRVELLKDIAKLTGGTLFDGTKELKPEFLGACEKIMTTQKETVITGGKDISEHIKDVEALMEAAQGEYDKEKIRKRVAQLRSKIGLIRVGGFTEMAAEEKKHLVDDAVAATEAALKEGYVPGGGVTYLELIKSITADTDGAKLLKKALEYPFRVLMKNCGLTPGAKLKEVLEQPFGVGFDAFTGELVDLKKNGIIDPALVIKQAVINSTSVAGQVLTAGVLITNKKEKNDEEEE